MAQPDAALLQDLCSRFILNVPAEELRSFERLLFYVEEAHWYYEDFERERNPERVLQSMSLKRFAALIFRECPGLEPFAGSLDKIYKAFAEYKQGIPVVGAILVNPGLDRCLLVRGWGNQGSWGFPRGKINENEPDAACAVREVFEETGLDISGRFAEEDCVEIWTKSGASQKRTKLFFVPGIDTRTEFAPQARKEISALAWHSIAELPSTFEENMQRFESEGSGVLERRHSFWGVWQYVRPLRRWIKEQRRRAHGKGQASLKAGSVQQGSAAKASAKGTPSKTGKDSAPVAFAGFAALLAPAAPPPFVGLGADRRVAMAATAPTDAAPLERLEQVTSPGAALRNFAFDRQQIMQHLIIVE